MPIVGQFGSLARAGSFLLPGGAMESIATVTVGSGGASSIDFTNIPSGFQHLQIRMIMPFTAQDAYIEVTMNGVTSGYSYHWLYGNGASALAYGLASQAGIAVAYDTNIARDSQYLKATIIDILDYGSTTKNKTVRAFSGIDKNGAGAVLVESGLYASTSAISSIKLRHYGNDGVSYGFKNLAQYSSAALYGLRAP